MKKIGRPKRSVVERMRAKAWAHFIKQENKISSWYQFANENGISPNHMQKVARGERSPTTMKHLSLNAWNVYRIGPHDVPIWECLLDPYFIQLNTVVISFCDRPKKQLWLDLVNIITDWRLLCRLKLSPALSNYSNISTNMLWIEPKKAAFAVIDQLQALEELNVLCINCDEFKLLIELAVFSDSPQKINDLYA